MLMSRLSCCSFPSILQRSARLLASRVVRRPVRLLVTLFTRSAVFGFVAMVNHSLFHELFVPLVVAVSVGLLWVHSSGRWVYVVASVAVAKLTPCTTATTSVAATATATHWQPAAGIGGKSCCGCCPATKHTHTCQHVGGNAGLMRECVMQIQAWCMYWRCERCSHSVMLTLHPPQRHINFICICCLCLSLFFFRNSFFLVPMFGFSFFLDGEWVIYSLVNVFPQLHKAVGVMSQKQQQLQSKLSFEKTVVCQLLDALNKI